MIIVKNTRILYRLGIILLCIYATVISSSQENLQNFARDIVACHNNMSIGIKAVSLTHDEELCATHEHCRFIPASNTKLFTAVAALEYLGPDYRFETDLTTDGKMKRNVLRGSLYLKASGDPSFTSANLEQLVASLRDYGITKITGNICVDMTEFDSEMFQPGSFVDNIGSAWNVPTTSFSLDGKAACLGWPCGGDLVSNEKLQATSVDIREKLHDIFTNNGIRIQGDIVAREVPEQVQLLAVHFSDPLSKLIQIMMKDSNNLYADCIFKKIGTVTTGTQGSWKQGYSAIKKLLEHVGINPHELVIMDGAGRSRYNLISPSHIVAVLQWAYKQPYFPYLFESLSIAGTDGTLKDRMKDLSHCIRGKTGTLLGASALCGYAVLPDDIVAFSILVNGFVANSVYTPPCKTEIEDAFCYCLHKRVAHVE